MQSIHASALVKGMVKKDQLIRYLYGFMITDCKGCIDSGVKMISNLLFLKYIVYISRSREMKGVSALGKKG